MKIDDIGFCSDIAANDRTSTGSQDSSIAVERFAFDPEGSVGLVPLSQGRFLVARGGGTPDKRYTGRLVVAESDPKHGLVIEK